MVSVTYGLLVIPRRPLLRKNVPHIWHLHPSIGPGNIDDSMYTRLKFIKEIQNVIMGCQLYTENLTQRQYVECTCGHR